MNHPRDHLLLDSVPNLGPLISRWKINKLIQKCQDVKVSKAFVSAIFEFAKFQRDMSGPILGYLSNNRWLRGTCTGEHFLLFFFLFYTVLILAYSGANRAYWPQNQNPQFRICHFWNLIRNTITHYFWRPDPLVTRIFWIVFGCLSQEVKISNIIVWIPAAS